MMNEHQIQLTDTLCDMRITIEGALALYDEDASPLYNMARKANQHEAASAFYALGKALFALRDAIMKLEVICCNPSTQQA